ncbi:MAG: FAD-dependent oxidoreductase [Euryarchaeota archaeon]|nr:FAD-dependent oxidoreductase [Euryarchaeota archaeon]
MYTHQILVVGGGLAGCRAAVAAADLGANVAILSRVHPVRSHSGAAQGGINGALGTADPKDSPEAHTYFTIKGSDFLADQDAVQTMCQEAPSRIIEMEHWGAPFSRMEDGRIAQRPFGGAGFPRTCFSADKTGHVLMHTLFEQCLKRQVQVYEERHILSLVVDQDPKNPAARRARGVIALHMTEGKLESYRADAVIMATGGAGRIYRKTTNAHVNTGIGMALAYWKGAPLEDMEFVQFHPTGLFGTNILISEGARAEGGYLKNKDGERFMKRYAEKFMELAPRDIVARAIATEINEGRGYPGGYVHLDLTHVGRERIEERLPGIRDLSINFAGVDPVEAPIPIQPSHHYTMGGIACDINGTTPLPGLYACGETACVSVHGANRLGGNSLLETVVFGARAGAAAAQYAKANPTEANGKIFDAETQAAEKKIRGLGQGEATEDYAAIKTEMGNTMDDQVQVFRNEKDLRRALDKIRELKGRFPGVRLRRKGLRYNLDLIHILELEAMLDLAEVITLGALARTESRGSHSRTDHPTRDDTHWLKHTLATHTPQGPKLDYKPVTITQWKPEARVY